MHCTTSCAAKAAILLAVLGGSSLWTLEAAATSGEVWGSTTGTTGTLPPPSPLPVPSPAAGVVTVQLMVLPATLPVGGSAAANVVARAVDASGNLVPGARLLLLTSAGTLRDVQDRGDGTVLAVLVPPADSQVTAIAVSAVALDAGASGTITVPLTGGTAGVASTPVTPVPSPPVSVSPSPPKKAAPLPRHGRILVLYPPIGFYTYDSTPCDAAVEEACVAPDVDLTSSRNGYDVMDVSAKAAVPLSIGVDGEFFPVDFIGVGGGFTRFGYSTTQGVEGTDNGATTYSEYLWNIHAEVRGRIPLTRRMGLLELVPRVGYHGHDATLFTWEDSESTTSGERVGHFQTKWLHGLRFGAALRWTLPMQWLEPHLGYDATWTFTVGGITNHHLNVGASFHALTWLVFDVAYDFQSRDFGMAFTGSDRDGDGEEDLQRGHISERVHALTFGAGVQF